MNVREALLQEVIRNPIVNEPRLAFADWAERNGEQDRAEFIRLQVKHGETEEGEARRKIVAAMLRRVATEDIRLIRDRPYEVHIDVDPGEKEKRDRILGWWPRWSGLTHATVIEGTNKGFWLSVDPKYYYPAILTHDPAIGIRSTIMTIDGRREEVWETGMYCSWEFRRGFISHVQCHWDHWLQFGTILCRTEPITSVCLTTCRWLNPHGRDVTIERLREQWPSVRRWIVRETWPMPGEWVATADMP